MKKLARFNTKNKDYRDKQYGQLAQIGAIAGGAIGFGVGLGLKYLNKNNKK